MFGVQCSIGFMQSNEYNVILHMKLHKQSVAPFANMV